MKTIKVLFLAAAVLFFGTVLVSAALAEQMSDMPGNAMAGSAAMPGPMGKMGSAGPGAMGKMGMMGPMMQGMMQKTVVATTDGGVIVAAGNKLMKYDKDLNLVKEVEIKIDMAAMKEHMQKMQENCPMMQGMGGDNAGAEDKASGFMPEMKK